MNKALSFVFEGFQVDLQKGEASFNFCFRGSMNIGFQEKLSFQSVEEAIPPELVKVLFENLMLILGISYYKLYCPKEISIKDNFLTKEQADFWNIVYTKGLGEFFYKNKINFHGLINFPYNQEFQVRPIEFSRKNRLLLGVGGGKDSIVAAEIFKEQNKEFDLISGEEEIKVEVSRAIGKEPIVFKRKLDPKLFELNKEKDSYNGHIPVSVIYAFIGLMASAFYDYGNFVVGNEESANYGNVEYLDEMINHQWSKSEEFEKLFNNYVEKFITPSIKYSSPLRNMTELQVVEKFCNYPKYFKIFSSCNRNFKIINPSSKRWCGECPKCLFVFICMAAFVPKKELVEIFGKNLFEDRTLIPLFDELNGIKNSKPFECVGTPEEVKEALAKIVAKGKFKNSELLKHYEARRVKK